VGKQKESRKGRKKERCKTNSLPSGNHEGGEVEEKPLMIVRIKQTGWVKEADDGG
jgi:hypothetical protein